MMLAKSAGSIYVDRCRGVTAKGVSAICSYFAAIYCYFVARYSYEIAVSTYKIAIYIAATPFS